MQRPKHGGDRMLAGSGNQPKIFGNPSTLFSFWGISDNSWKKKETAPNSLLGPISVLRRFHSTAIASLKNYHPWRHFLFSNYFYDSSRFGLVWVKVRKDWTPSICYTRLPVSCQNLPEISGRENTSLNIFLSIFSEIVKSLALVIWIIMIIMYIEVI